MANIGNLSVTAHFRHRVDAVWPVDKPSRGKCARCGRSKWRGKKGLKLRYLYFKAGEVMTQRVCGPCGRELTEVIALHKVVNG